MSDDIKKWTDRIASHSDWTPYQVRAAMQAEIDELREYLGAISYQFDRAFLDWVADRLVYAKGDQPDEPHVKKLRRMAGSTRA